MSNTPISFLKDLKIECIELQDHIAIYSDIKLDEKELNVLSSFWNLSIRRHSPSEWSIGGVKVIKY